MLITVWVTSQSLATLITAAGYTLDDRVVSNMSIDIQNLWATDIFVEANRPATIAWWYKIIATTWEKKITPELWISWKPISLLSKIFLITATGNTAVRILENI